MISISYMEPVIESGFTDGATVSILNDIYDAVGDDEALARFPAALASKVQARRSVLQLFSPAGNLVNLQFSPRSVSLDTVRNQIKALLQKTDATRLGELIALLARTIRTR